jgi:hypothetical protein
MLTLGTQVNNNTLTNRSLLTILISDTINMLHNDEINPPPTQNHHRCMPRANTVGNSLTTTSNESFHILQIRRITDSNRLPSLILRRSSLALQRRRNNNQENRLILTIADLGMARQIDRNKGLISERVALENAHIEDFLIGRDRSQLAREAAEHGHAGFGWLAAWAIGVAVDERGDGAVL